MTSISFIEKKILCKCSFRKHGDLLICIVFSSNHQDSTKSIIHKLHGKCLKFNYNKISIQRNKEYDALNQE